MAYTTTKTTTTGYGTRVKNSCSGVFVGILMFIAGTILLAYNECNAVKNADAIEEMGDNLVEMSVDKVDKSFEGKLIHTTGNAVSQEELTDEDFQITAKATKLIRSVEFYQWYENVQEKTESKDKFGGKEETTTVTTYTYEKRWVDSPINSGNFNQEAVRSEQVSMHEPISNMVVAQNCESENFVAKNVSFGAYRLPDFFINSINEAESYDISLTDDQLAYFDNLVRTAYGSVGRQLKPVLTQGQVAQAPVAPAVQDTTGVVAEDSVEMPTEWEPTQYEYVHVSGNMVYLGENPGYPQIGDARITFSIVPAENAISIIAQVVGDTFTQYTAKNGKTRSEFAMGTKSSAEMIQAAKDANTLMTWVLRILGILLVIGGIKGIFNIVVTLAKVIPFISTILNFGAGLVATILGLVWSLLIIVLFWIIARPVLGIILLVIIGGIIFLAVKFGKKKAPKAEEVKPEA